VEGDGVRDSCCGAPLRVIHPLPRQVQLPVDPGAAFRTAIAEEHADLAILDAPCRPTVLAGHPTRVRALLQEPRLVHGQDAIRIAQVLHHVAAEIIAHRVRIPP
jgi:hypothetical protein